MKRCGIAVIGYGNIGSAHVTALMEDRIPGAYLAMVCDIDPERLKLAARRFGGIRCCERYGDAAADPEVDAVIVSVPHPLHAEIALCALRCGKHVLVEKPLDVRMSVARRLAEEAAGTGLVFAEMLNQRTDPLFVRARSVMRSGRIGEMIRSVWTVTNWFRTQEYYDSGSWRATWRGEGGGVLMNQAPHNLDLWQWICGMPETVTGFCDVARHHRIEVEDEACILTRYSGGATGIMMTSTGEFPGTNRLEISGTRGKMVLEDGRLSLWELPADMRGIKKDAELGSAKAGMKLETYGDRPEEDGHVLIIRNFVNAVLYGEPLISPGEDGLNELMISNAAYLSAWKGNVAVRLPLDEKEYDRMLDEKIRASVLKPDTVREEMDGRYSERWSVRWK